MINIPRWNVILIIVITALSLLYALPNALPQSVRENMAAHLPAWAPIHTVTLGLDLQGGSHLLLEVKTDVAVTDRLNVLVDQIRGELRGKNINYENLGENGGTISVIISKPEDVEAARRLIAQVDQGLEFTTSDRTISAKLSEAAIREREKQVVEQSIEIVRRRIDETGTREPSIQREGTNRIVVQLPGLNDPERIKNLLGKTAKLTFRMVNDDPLLANNPSGMRTAPAGYEVLQSNEKDGRSEIVSRRIVLTGEMLTDAQANFQDGMPVVSFAFDNVGGRKLAEISSQNVGKRFAIVLDNKVISAPVFREPITGGRGVISGNFTTESAQDLALLLRAGALPAPLVVMEERTVGAGLGSDSIHYGIVAMVIGFLAIVALMILCYGLFGFFAILSLIVNLAMILTCMTLLGGTLTLPGIAGIVLVIGTTVDANVLIYERMRDEYRHGRTLLGALDAGYSRAMSAITDANVTHMIGAALMFWFGTGPIKGFAVTLCLGIITSLFTAIMLNRLMVVTWTRLTKPKSLPI